MALPLEVRRPVVVPADAGETLAVRQDRFVYKLTAAQSAGSLGVIERTVAPSFQSPPQEHTHTREDWAYYVLEGRIGLLLDGEEHLLARGGFVFVPRGVYFRWWNPDAAPARVLALYSPGAFADFFRDVVTRLAPKVERIGSYEATLDDIRALQDRYGMVRKPLA
jgi:quercetin dioxygenase-like cupin family protein